MIPSDILQSLCFSIGIFRLAHSKHHSWTITYKKGLSENSRSSVMSSIGKEDNTGCLRPAAGGYSMLHFNHMLFEKQWGKPD